MPLLRNEPFIRCSVPEDLRPDEEVFYCELTSEVFRKYDDYFNRTILLNSMVWTCSVTGNSGLTYEEAAKSEKAHRKKRTSNSQSPVKMSTTLADDNTTTTPSSPNESLTPALENAAALLTMLTGRGFLNDLLADLYTHLKDHYVVDDIVEFATKDGKKKTGKVIAVEYCGKDKTGEDSIEQHRYSVEVSDGKKDKGKLFTVAYKDILRRKSILSKTRCRNFIKMYCIVSDSTVYKLKDSAKTKFGLTDDQKFTSTWRKVFGSNSKVPRFPYTPLARKPPGHAAAEEKPANNGQMIKKEQQPPPQPQVDVDRMTLERRKIVIASLEQELQRFNLWPVDEVLFTLKTVEAERAMAKLREDLKIAREMEKERLKDEKKKMLEWKKMRDDLECDDHKPLPKFPILHLPEGLSEEQFGDCLSLHNFLSNFGINSKNDGDFYDEDDDNLQQFDVSKKLDKKFLSTLHENFVAKLSSNSLNVNENAFLKLLQWFLAAILEKYDEEEEEVDEDNVNEQLENGAENILEDSEVKDDSTMGFFDPKYINDSTSVHNELKKTYGVSLKHLILNHRTVTEILRLFLLTSGHYSNGSRAQTRGGYKCWDDFVFAVRIRRPDLVDKLSRENVLALNFDDRLQILLTLRDQLMTFGSFRLFVQQRMDRISTLKQELRQWLLHEQRWDKEARAAKIILDQEVKKEGGQEESSQRTPEMYLLLKKYVEGGRSKRDKLKLVLWEGVDFGQMTSSQEIDEVQKIQKDFLNDELSNIRQHIKVLRNLCGWLHLGRDRGYRNYWYLSEFNSILVEHCPLDDYHFLDLNSKCLETATPLDKTEFDPQTLLVCTGRQPNPQCPVHDQSPKNRWLLVDNLQALFEALNSRGFRELELAENLKFLQLCDENFSLNCDATIFCKEEKKENDESSLERMKYQLAFEMRTRLLELEENLHRRSLASWRKADREKWRSDLDNSVSENKNDDESVLKFMTSCLEQLASTFDVKFFNRKSAFFLTKKQESRIFEQWCRSLQQGEPRNWSRFFLDLDTFENAVNWQKVGTCSSTSKNDNNKGRKNSLENGKNARRSSPPPPAPMVVEEIVGDFSSTSKPEKVKSRKNSLENSDVSNKNGRRSSPPPTSVVEAVSDDTSTTSIRQDKVNKNRKSVLDSSAVEDKMVNGHSEGDVSKPPSKKRRRIRCSSSASSSSSVESGEIRETATSTTTMSKTTATLEQKIEVKPQATVTSRTGRMVKKPISFEDLMTESKKNVVTNRALIVQEASSSTSNGLSVVKKVQPKSTFNQDLPKCQAILRFATHFPDAWPFLKPVSKVDAPDYYETIKKPMDFQTLRENLERGDVYKNFQEFFNDLKLIFDNCRAYNESHAPVYKCGEKLEKYVNQKIRDFKN